MKLFLKRSFAYLFDCGLSYTVLMLFLQWLVLSPIRENMGYDEVWFQDPWHLQAYVWLSISLPVWAYFAILDSRIAKGTFGKRLLRIKVVNNKDSSVSISRSFVRTFFKLLPWELAHIGVIFPTPLYFSNDGGLRSLSMAGIALLIIFALSIVLSKENQSLYDRLLGTYVRNKKSLDQKIIIQSPTA